MCEDRSHSVTHVPENLDGQGRKPVHGVNPTLYLAPPLILSCPELSELSFLTANLTGEASQKNVPTSYLMLNTNWRS